jgi:hypothetical protein
LPEKLKVFIEARRREKAAASTEAATKKTEAGAAGKPKGTRLRKKKA